MRTLLACFVLAAVTAALAHEAILRHPLPAASSSGTSCLASFLSFRSALFAKVTELSPAARRSLFTDADASLKEITPADLDGFLDAGFRMPENGDGTPGLRAFVSRSGDACLMAVFRTEEDADLLQSLAAALGGAAGTGPACRGESCGAYAGSGVDLTGFAPDGYPSDGLAVSAAVLPCPAYSFVTSN